VDLGSQTRADMKCGIGRPIDSCERSPKTWDSMEWAFDSLIKMQQQQPEGVTLEISSITSLWEAACHQKEFSQVGKHPWPPHGACNLKERS